MHEVAPTLLALIEEHIPSPTHQLPIYPSPPFSTSEINNTSKKRDLQ